MPTKIESAGNLVKITIDSGTPFREPINTIRYSGPDSVGIYKVYKNLPEHKISEGFFSDFLDSSNTPYASGAAFEAAIDDIIGSSNGGGAGTILKTGFIDYNDTTGNLSLTANVWTDVPNDGAGAFSNNSYKPDNINEVLDTNTGYLDFSELSLGSQIIVRNDFQVTPSTNNSLLQLRYVLGQGVNEYNLLFWSERLDSGSGIAYQRVVSFPIYMGDTNTLGGPGKLQVNLSTSGVFNNAGSYINISVR